MGTDTTCVVEITRNALLKELEIDYAHDETPKYPIGVKIDPVPEHDLFTLTFTFQRQDIDVNTLKALISLIKTNMSDDKMGPFVLTLGKE